MTITFHIRGKRGAEHRERKTLCGAERTNHDNTFSWQPLPAGKYVPCEECCRIRLAILAEKKRAREPAEITYDD